MTNKSIVGILPLIIMCIFFVTSSCKKHVVEDIPEGTVTDLDGNVYHTVKIGSQVWMIENLNTTRYSNGDLIPEVSDAGAWSRLASGAQCSYNNSSNYSAIYGRLYNWFAVKDGRNIAPQGWHVATDTEWTTLINYLGGITAAGGKMKEQDNTHWAVPNIGGSNVSGFTALPGGYRDDLGEFSTLAGAYWWTSTPYSESALSGGWSWNVLYNSAGAVKIDVPAVSGQSVRCIKD